MFIGELRRIIKQRAQHPAIEITYIQILIGLNIMGNELDTVTDMGVGKASKTIKLTTKKC